MGKIKLAKSPANKWGKICVIPILNKTVRTQAAKIVCKGYICNIYFETHFQIPDMEDIFFVKLQQSPTDATNPKKVSVAFTNSDFQPKTKAGTKSAIKTMANNIEHIIFNFILL